MSTHQESSLMSTQEDSVLQLTLLSQEEIVPVSSQEESVLLTVLSQGESAQMSTQADNVQRPTMSTQGSVSKRTTEQQTPRRPCRAQYRLRRFYSKGAFLILIWILLASTASGIPLFMFLSFLTATEYSYFFYLISLPFLVGFAFALLSGWIADALLGNYRTVKAAAVFLFISLTLFCVLLILLQLVMNQASVSLAILLLISSCLGLAGRVTMIINSLQLGLDQMPDASTENKTSFIAWFVLCIFTGVWLGGASRTLLPCINQLDFLLRYFEIWSLLAVLCASIILCSDFLLTPKWLTKEPKSPQSLKGIFKVLRYATKHKHPVQRSALTFWEEELPSRIDFGKSKYGGPFTIEQVENVKTVLRMLVVSIPMWIIFTSTYLLQTSINSVHANGTNVTETTDCSEAAVKLFTSNSNWWLIVALLINEFTIYPLTRKVPSILKRFGAASLVLILVNSTYLILNSINLSYNIEDPMGWSHITRSIMAGVLKLVLLTSALEFACAQTPFDMRSLSIGYVWCIVFFSSLISTILVNVFDTLCTSPYCTIIYYSLATALSVVGFVLHCFLARWYKRRKRDDINATQQWVEEAYDRYLERTEDRSHFNN